MLYNIFYIYLVFINTFAFLIMYVDKQKAKKHEWRVPELRLFTIAVFLGSPGVLIGMYVFHHKTKHLKFILGIPFILIIQLIIYFYFVLSFPK